MSINVLIADIFTQDSENIKNALQATSNSLGKVHVTNNAKEARDVILETNNNIGLIMTEIKRLMPPFSGYDLLNALCCRPEALESLKVPDSVGRRIWTKVPRIVITGETNIPGLKEMMKKAVVTGVFSKSNFATSLAITGASTRKTVSQLILDFAHYVNTANNERILSHSTICQCNEIDEGNFIRSLGTMGTTINDFRNTARDAATRQFAPSFRSSSYRFKAIK